MKAKHDAEYLRERYNELYLKEQCTKNRTMSALYRDEMRKIKKILLNKYKIILDKRN